MAINISVQNSGRLLPDIIVLRFVQRLGRGRGCHKLVPVLGGNGIKIALPGTYLTNPLVT